MAASLADATKSDHNLRMAPDPGWQVSRRPDLLSALTASQDVVLGPVIAAAAELNLPVYLVGGIVRDLVMKRPHGPDLDIVVEGDALALGDLVAGRHGGELTRYPAFGTATWQFAGAGTDLVTARRETYAHPGALPDVAPGTLLEDLFRRDFTVNAMALALHRDQRGELVDPHGGEVDILRQVLAILHPRSFLDDPTRLLRGLRLATRLGFAVEANTERLIPAALPVLAAITPARLLAEVEYVFAEADPAAVLRRWAAAEVLPAITPGLGVPARLEEQLDALPLLWSRPGATAAAPENDAAADDARPEPALAGAYRLVLWLAGHPAPVARRAAARLGFRRDAAELLDHVLDVRGLAATTPGTHDDPHWADSHLDDAHADGLHIASAPLADASAPVSALHRHLRHIGPDALRLASLVLGDTPSRNLRRYLAAIEANPPLVSGDDLKTLGIAPGPIYRHLLATTYDEQLDGALRTRPQALSFVHQLVMDMELPGRP